MVYWCELFLHLPPYSFSFFLNILIVKFLLKMPNLQILAVKTGRLDHKEPISTFSPHCHVWIPKCGVLHGIPPLRPPKPFFPVLNTQIHFTRMPYLLSSPSPKIYSGDTQGHPTLSAGTDVLRTSQCHGWNSNPEFYTKPYLLNWPAYNKITTLSLPNWR